MFLKIHQKKCNGFQQKKLCKPTLLQSKLLLLSCELPLHLFLAWLDCIISILPADSVRGKANRVSERSRARERSEYCGTSKRVSGASERASGRASDPLTQYCSLDSWLNSGPQCVGGSEVDTFQSWYEPFHVWHKSFWGQRVPFQGQREPFWGY